MSLKRVLSKSKGKSMTATAALAAAAAACLLLPSTASAGASAVSLPPPHAGFDYQIGGAYTPPTGVQVVSRDHEATPAAGLYNICYVNAFQAQPDAEGQWDDDLLLRDASGEIVYDGDWGEAVLDIRTADKRQRIAAKVGGWIDGCAAKGFQAVEPDNYDTFTRFPDYLTANQAKAFIALLADRAHARGLAIAQKNTAELAGAGKESGLDFAVVEECGAYGECDDFTAEYGSHVVVVEYTASGLSKACAGWGGELSIVRRDVDVSPAGSSGYLRRTC
ncbi:MULTISPECIES: endo alpha-1,4 polygalactosaminidase [unclassified Streptomyces]|uniref:endo alpha-1,4 polygalactosaminidase n=1 Tax=unclassified Streptomyces TaxID=2593676 RepID=UPI002DD84FAD|nr:endo alpha-1,4 polygalactosaminidase [Streptomyces sp. NBC_01257]WRZ62492.1 endo alpha-1,4 polygalactosaminidase [Streptomyces sp. NBC_01257]